MRVVRVAVPRPRRRISDPAVGLGFRSGLEERLAEALRHQGVRFLFEEVAIPYLKKPAFYRPDFLLLDNGILIESKGYFLAQDRTKHLLVREQHPDLDIRFLFARANTPLRRGSRTSYSAWAEKHGFKWAEAHIPRDWIEEPAEPRRMAAVAALLNKTKK